MPVTWCYDVEGDQKYCSPGFPIGCYVTKEGRGKDACVTSVSLRVFGLNRIEIGTRYHKLGKFLHAYDHLVMSV